jgi:ABC-type sugar transport system permease subunit
MGVTHRHRRFKLRFRDVTPYLFLLPFGIPFLIFFAYPIIQGFFLSFSFQNLMTGEQYFIGLKNYIDLFRDEVFVKSVVNTLIFVVANVPLLVGAGLALAIMLNESIRGRVIFRSIFVAPYLITGAAVAIICQFILSTTGLLNYYLVRSGLPPQGWLGKPGQAWLAIVLITLWWRVGFPAVVFLAGLQDVPDELYEAARIDGASDWQCFWRITIPMLRPVIMFVAIMRFIASFQVFDQVYLVTVGGPYGSTRVMIQYLYENGFQYYKTAYASAIGWVLFGMVLIVTLIQMKFFRMGSAYD